ncbi:MAG: 3-oxoacyl-ACP reductase family protein [Peptococcaceae bacterium]|jgi:2-hydroxycyclohexanecarboxyl-CoA dehydrogenase|nr:3-oxoacyl-ACP reductase FabG [Peptococcaceae bacterium]MDH7525577.1 3-oxoacyl-ACP reductase family protein [Peptococcaceae bacterium]
MRLKDKVAIVTGSASGLGLGIVKRMAREGARVVVADLNFEGAKKAAAEIEASGGQAMPYKLDVTKYDQACAMVKDVLERWGQIDILVNNAGWDKFGPFADSTEDVWDKIIAINYRGNVNCCHAVWKYFLERKYGKIINIASDAGRAGSSGETVYAGTKGAIIAFTKSLAREGARAQINVNCICPGPADTPLFAEMKEERPKLAEALLKAIPFGRLAVPEDIAAGVVFFASDEASYITGQTLSISGGLTMM